jgi:predicted RNA binding protein YcfA (HicA-like mRNA interferase family)
MIVERVSLWGLTITITQMKNYKVSEILKMLRDDGWVLIQQQGSHRQFKHPTKKGKVTVNKKPNETLSQEILNSIYKQAGWK